REDSRLRRADRRKRLSHLKGKRVWVEGRKAFGWLEERHGLGESNLSAEDFGYTPGLGETAARGVGRVAVKDFGDLTGTSGLSVVEQRREQGGNPVASSFAIEANIGGNERAEQPGPDGALVVGGVALLRRALVAAFIRGILRGQRAQAEGRE